MNYPSIKGKVYQYMRERNTKLAYHENISQMLGYSYLRHSLFAGTEYMFGPIKSELHEVDWDNA